LTLPWLADVQAATERLAGSVVRTPLERSHGLSQRTGLDVWLKYECFQTTGSFKLRGALNALLLLSQRDRAKGVITVSAGNHALGIAHAARILQIRATVVLPETASPAKIEALKHSGADLLLEGDTYDEAERMGRELAQRAGAVFVSAYNDPAVVAGAGTVALEVLQDLPRTRAFVVPAGGGGLISGVGITAHGLDPAIAVYGAQSTASPALHAALEAGKLTTVNVEDSIADGLAGNVEHDSITFELIRKHVHEILLVEEPEIADTMRSLLEEEHVLVEGAAAVGVAAILKHQAQLDGEGPVVVVLTGRNVAASVLQQYVLAR
jgi:threonine dehydratase